MITNNYPKIVCKKPALNWCWYAVYVHPITNVVEYCLMTNEAAEYFVFLNKFSLVHRSSRLLIYEL